MGVSLITTVKDEETTIMEFLKSISDQTKSPDEIVIVDGGSSDHTVELIESFPKLRVTVIQEKSNIAKGRNIAIRSSRNEIIAVTDAGCRLRKDWLERITKFHADTDVVAGNYKPILNSIFDACQYSIMNLYKSDKTLDTFVISSRSLAFKKKVWEDVGGYPEWLNFSEDTYFHDKIKRGHHKIRFERDAIVEWSQRRRLREIFRQFFLYMEGDGMARMHTIRHLTRFSTYIGAVALVALSVANAYYLIPLALGFLIYLSVPCYNFIKLRKYSLAGRSLFIIAFLLVFSDVAKMTGYLSGLMKGGIKRSWLLE